MQSVTLRAADASAPVRSGLSIPADASNAPFRSTKWIEDFDEVVSPLARSVLTSLHFDTHHRVNLPRSVIGKMASPVWLIFESVANVEVRLADNLYDRRLIDVQFSCRAGVKWKSRMRPAKNRCSNLTPLR